MNTESKCKIGILVLKVYVHCQQTGGFRVDNVFLCFHLSTGPGPESERFIERTFKMRPQKQPTAVQVFGINPSTIKVTWRYVAPTVQEEPLTGQ